VSQIRTEVNLTIKITCRDGHIYVHYFKSTFHVHSGSSLKIQISTHGV